MHLRGGRAGSTLARWVVVVGAGFVVLVAIAALRESASMLLVIASSPARRLGLDGALVALAGTAAISAGIGVALVAARSRLTDRQLLWCALGLVALVRGGMVVVMDAPLANDGRAYQELARWLAGGGCCFADRPTGYPMLLAAAYRLAGDGSWVHEAVNVAAALIGGWLLFDLVRGAIGRVMAAVAVGAYALQPGLALLTPLLLTDTVYATTVIALCWAAVRMGTGRIWPAVAGGVLLAFSQYIRPVGPALLPALALVPLLYLRPMRRAATMIGVMAVAFAVAMLPAAANNLATHGDISVSTSSYGGWSLFMGTNQDTNGRYSDADAAIIDGLPGESLWERSAVAGQLGRERITSDPIGFAGLVVRKFGVMWGTEEFGIVFAFRPDGQPRGGLAGLDLLAQLAYLALVVAAAAGLLAAIRRRGPPDPLLVVAVALLLCEALVHTFLEVKPRYHAHSEVLLLLMAASAGVLAADRAKSPAEPS
jgi:hypothetical protein